MVKGKNKKKASELVQEKVDNKLMSDFDQLAELSKKELVGIAKNLKIKNYSRLEKSELAKLIVETRALDDKNGSKEDENKESVPNSKTVSADKAVKDITESEFKVNQEKLLMDSYDQLAELSKKELVEIAKNLKIKNYSRLEKSELAKLIVETRALEDKTTEEAIKESFQPPVASNSEKQENKPAPVPLKAAPAKTYSAEELNQLSKEELIEIAKEFKIKNYSRLAKSRLVKLISQAQPAEVISEKSEEVEETEKTGAENKLKKIIDEIEPESINDLSEHIAKIGQNVKRGYLDEREAKTLEAEIKNKFLLKPSRYEFGNINKEFLLEDEEDIVLPDSYNEDTIVLLPIDPYRLYIYWDFSTETGDLIRDLHLSELVLKINDVTSIVYNGFNANHYWFENCLAHSKNWYINMLDGNKDICIEIGYFHNGNFRVIARSNTIYVPRRTPSTFENDTFVVVNYEEQFNFDGASTPTFGEDTSYKKPEAKVPPIPRERFGVDQPIDRRMPYFVFDHNYSIPAREEKPHSPLFFPEPAAKAFEPTQHFTEEFRQPEPAFIPTIEKTQTYETTETVRFDPVYSEYWYNIELPQDMKIFFGDKWFKKITFGPEQGSFMQWFWVSDVIPGAHDKFFRISWGPIWVKEYVGGSEVIRFLGASERFLGASEMFLGGSEMYLGGSEMYMGGSEMYHLGGSEKFLGGSEMFLGGSEQFLGGSEILRFLGGSEQFHDYNNVYVSYLRKK